MDLLWWSPWKVIFWTECTFPLALCIVYIDLEFCLLVNVCFVYVFYRTFALIKPDGVKCKGRILKIILENGFRIGNLTMVEMRKDQVEELYSACLLYTSRCV